MIFHPWSRLLAFWAGACCFIAGCGDLAGNAITWRALPEEDAGVIVDAGPPSVADSGEGSVPPEPPAGGLCAPCNDSSECGGDEDLCLVNQQTDERFCGRHCHGSADCPAEYECRSIADAPDQCLPVTDTCRDNQDAAVVPDLVAYQLQLINALRADSGLAPYVLDDCLSGIAMLATEELVRDREYHGKYRRECVPVKPYCECGWDRENQAVSDGPSPTEAIAAGFETGLRTELFADNVLSSSLARVGIAVIVTGNVTWVSAEFGP
jgi:hypothetical protein